MSRIWNGAVGSSWNADRKTVNVNPHMTKKCGVKRRSDDIDNVRSYQIEARDSLSEASLGLEGDDRVDARRTPRGHEARKQRHQRKRDGDADERQRIGRTHSVEHRPHEARG